MESRRVVDVATCVVAWDSVVGGGYCCGYRELGTWRGAEEEEASDEVGIRESRRRI